MARTTWALITLACLAVPGSARAADEAPPAGTWKLTFLEQTREGTHYNTFWIIKLAQKDGKWSGKVIATAPQVRRDATVETVSVTGGRVQLTLKMVEQIFSFEGKVPNEAGVKKLPGSFAQGQAVVPAFLEATKLESLDRFEVLKDRLTRLPDDPEAFNAALVVLSQATAQKAKPEEVRGWADRAFRAAETYGPRWQREFTLRMADVLIDQDAFASVALETARKAERMLDAKDDVNLQMRTLNLLAKALRKAKKDDEAKEVEARIARINVGVKPEAFAGRKAKSDRAVLLELFTGSECPPCVAADLAFDALLKTYKPSDVVLLQYHMHIPGPDPMANRDCEERFKYYVKHFGREYGDDILGTPVAYVGGKPEIGGGAFDKAAAKYKDYRTAIEPLLEKPASVKLKATATRKGAKVTITAEASDLEKPAETVRLRLALVEEQVRYAGANNIRVHHHVVRDLPGGAEGLALKEKTGKQTAVVDLDELRKKLGKYLDDVAKEEPFSSKDRPLDLKRLRVVAFVQDDQTREVLQVVEIPVPGEE
jgi:hypothetical protein